MVVGSDQTDAWLVERCRAHGDDEAFGQLVTRYQARVFRLVVSVLGQEFAADAEDLAQEVFLRVHHALGAFRGDAEFGTWVYRVAFNHALNVKARMRFRAPHEPDTALAGHASGMPAPDAQLHQQQRAAAVLACLHDLPDVYQSALRLHYWLGAGMSEIAEMLETPENTIKSYLHRARKLLRARLAERGFHE